MKLSKTAIICVIIVIAAALIAAFVLLGSGGKTPESAKAPVSNEAETAANPEVDSDSPFSAGLSADGTWEGIKALDYVKLGDYSKIKLERSAVTATDENVEAQVKALFSDAAGEITDALVKEKYEAQYGWKTTDDVRRAVKEDLEKTLLNSAIYKYLLDSSEITEIPQSMKENKKAAIIDYYDKYFASIAMQQEISWSDFISMCGYKTEEELYDSYDAEIESTLTLEMIYLAVAEDARVKVTDEDLKEYFSVALPGEDQSSFEKNYGKPYLMNVVLKWKTEKLLEDMVELN